ncbi:MAG: hypothetical protein ABRQ39_07100 [Candidatus Eremiobacterota bacterium]
MRKNNYAIAFIIISILTTIIVMNGCGDDATVTPVSTATPTKSATATFTPISPTPTFTPTPVPTRVDISSQFNLSAEYVISPGQKTGVMVGTLTVHVYQKTTSTINIQGFEILASDNNSTNPNFPFAGATLVSGVLNPPEDWSTKADLTMFQWQGTTPLTKGSIYNFNISYSTAPPMPTSIKVVFTGGTAQVNTKTGVGAEMQQYEVGNAVINIEQKIEVPTPVPTFSKG